MVGPLGGSSKTTLRETKEGSHVPLKVNFSVNTGDVRPGPQDGESIEMNTDSHTEENCVVPRTCHPTTIILKHWNLFSPFRWDTGLTW